MKKDVLELRPTQFVLGMREVAAKIARIVAMDGKKVRDYVEKHPVPCVLGPGGQPYLIDQHHFLSACYHARVDKVVVEVLDDKASLSYAAFWEFMRSKSWLYLGDQFGGGPHEPERLPLDIRWLGDDLFRSLAWELREAGLIEKVQQPFSEFKWAHFLRQRLAVDLHTSTYEQAVTAAIKCFKESAPSK